MKNFSRLMAVSVLAMVALTFSACGSSYSTPEELGQTYATAMKDFDTDTMVSLYIESEREEMKKGLEAMKKMMEGKDTPNGDSIAYDSVSEETVEGKTYRVVKIIVGSASVNGGKKQPVTTDMVAVEVDGGWLFSLADEKAYSKAKRAERDAKRDAERNKG